LDTDSGHCDQQPSQEGSDVEDGTPSFLFVAMLLSMRTSGIITSDEQRITAKVTLALTHNRRRFADTFYQRLKQILVDPLKLGCSLLVNMSFPSVVVVCSYSVLQAILDTCHSGTLLDLPHYHCNSVYVPWHSKGYRRTATMHDTAGMVLPLHHAALH
jgi:hypothetical protein